MLLSSRAIIISENIIFNVFHVPHILVVVLYLHCLNIEPLQTIHSFLILL